MPVYFKKNNSDGSRIAIWRMTEKVDELFTFVQDSHILMSEVESFRSETRKKEWLTVRILLNEILKVAQPDEIIYDDKGKPHLPEGKGHISFSHTKNFAAIIYHPERTVGIDIESMHERIEYISHKFLNADEAAFITENQRKEMLHIIWGIKEVLFKIYGRGGVDFKNHLLVYPFKPDEEGIVKAEIKKDNRVKDFRINYFFTKEFLLVYGVG